MRIRFYNEDDEWSTEGDKITEADKLAVIRTTLEDVGPIIVEHWFYRGGGAPQRQVFEDYQEFAAYLEREAWAGDSIWVWNFASVCGNENSLARGKCPDPEGKVPKGGAY